MGVPSTQDPLLGAELGGYRIESRIARGGMSVVYLARDVELDRPVALKVLAHEWSATEGFRERFNRESRLAASIDHPNIVSIYKAGEADGRLWIAMRYVKGEDLRSLLQRERTLDPAPALAILGQVASALDAAHAVGLVHRDVKPGNVLIAEQEHGHVYLGDFGLTKRQAEHSTIGGEPGFRGTIDYAAPEQIRGQKVDAWTDLYALACVLFECLAGRAPFWNLDLAASMYAHFEPPPSVVALRPELPAALDAVLARALAVDQAERREYPTCAALVESASAVLRGMGAGPPATVSAPRADVATRQAVAREALAPGAATPEALAPEAGRAKRPVGGARRRRRRRIVAGGALLAVAAGGALAFAMVRGTGAKGSPLPPGVSGIFMVRPDGTDARAVLSERVADSAPSLSPDGRWIAFVSGRSRNNDIYVMPTAGGTPVNITNDPSRDLAPAWSPDGKRILFVSDRRGKQDVFVCDRGGANLRGLTTNGRQDYSPAWSPDGERIAFVSNRDGFSQIWVMDPDGGDQHPLTHDPISDAHPTWSPDGAFIAFHQGRFPNREIVVMRSDGTEERDVSNDPADDSTPEWSPRDDRILFVRNVDGVGRIFVMDADGSNQRPLVADTIDEMGPHWSHDARWVVFARSA